MKKFWAIIAVQLPGGIIVILSIVLLYIFSLLWKGNGQAFIYEYNRAILVSETLLWLVLAIYGVVLWVLALRKATKHNPRQKP